MTKESKRIIIVLVAMCMMFISLIVYISYFQIFKAEGIKYNSYNKRLWIDEEKTLRGSIFDRNGKLLVYSEKNEESQLRHYKYGRLYSHVIGYSYREYGKTGLELKYNNDLLDISVNQAINEFKNMVSEKSIGNDLQLTIDHGLQEKARNLLDGKKGSVIAMNPSTGEVYAMVSLPDFDADNLRNDWKTISENPESPLLNRATQGLYQPGSIFKLIPAIALIEDESIDKTYNCVGKTVIDGYTIRDYNEKGHGEISLPQALALSCNTYFAEKSILIGKDKMGEVAERFKINKSIDFDLPLKTSKFPYKDSIGETEIAAAAIGQGKVEVTPLNMLLIASTIANDGEMSKPKIAKSIMTADGEVKRTIDPIIIDRPIDRITANRLKENMVDVVNSGTGKAAAISGLEVAGKTGTAENSSGNSHAWFLGFAPADDPRVAVVVLLEEEGSTGGKAAAPIARDIMKYAIDNIKN